MKCTWEDPQLIIIYHIFCDRLRHVKPIKYEIDSYLEAKYGDFYKGIQSMEVSKFLKIFKKNKTFTRYVFSLKSSYKDQIHSSRWSGFHLSYLIMALDPEKTDIFAKLDNNEKEFLANSSAWDVSTVETFLENYPIWNPIKLAIEHPNPIRFIIDHMPYCSNVYERDIIKFLTEKSENFQETELMDILSDKIYFGYDHLEITLIDLIEGIGKALENPDLQKRAAALLVYLGSFIDYGKDIPDPQLFTRALARR